MKAVISKSSANGVIKAPPSKSMAHRYIICAALSGNRITISNVDFSEDILATLDCIVSLGAKVSKTDDSVSIEGFDLKNLPAQADFYCRESGSTMRFFMGIALCLGIKGRFFGSTTLRSRPFGIYEELCSRNDILFLRQDEYIQTDGILDCGEFYVKGNVSSQFITGLLFGLPLKDKPSVIKLIPPVESRSYIDLTIKAMSDCNIDLKWQDENTIYIGGGQKYRAADMTVEGDFSNAAFLEAFNTIGGKVDVTGLNDDSLQGDRVYRQMFESLKKGKPVLDISNCPDLGPVLFCVAAANNGAEFTGTRRLKMKESDRGRVMCEELTKLLVPCEYNENSIVIGKFDINSLDPEGILICGHNDHRIVMSFAVLLSLIGGSISEAQAVRKSYPGFFEDITALGIGVNLEKEE